MNEELEYKLSRNLSVDLEIIILERRLRLLKYITTNPHSNKSIRFEDVRSRKALIETLQGVEGMVEQASNNESANE